MRQSLLLSFLLSIVFNITLSSQSITIKGIVTDHSKAPLPNATCVAISAADSTFLQFSLSNIDGEFQLRDLKPQEILLQITFLGYEQYSKKYTLSAQQTNVDIGMVPLVQSDVKLDEVLITGETTPILVQKDTLIYNANAFETTANEVVEDLLRKMPGIEVEDDGTVIAQGEEVEKVTVDGKDFFGNDPKVATKNLPAKAIDRVEFFNKQSEMSEFTGVDDGERIKTMNLELKEDHKKGQFGNITGAYGTDERYEGKFSLNRFTSNFQLATVGNFNNINQQGFSVDDYRSFMGSMGGFRSRDGGLPINSGLSDGFVTTNAGGMNLNYDFSPKTKINLSYFLNDIENSIESIRTRENFFNARNNYFTVDEGNQLSENTNHRVTMRLDHKIDSTQDIRLTSNISLNNAGLTSYGTSSLTAQDIVENQGSSNYLSDGEGTNLSGALMYRKKLGAKRNKSLTLNMNLNTSDEEFLASLESENDFFPEDPTRRYLESIMQRQTQKDDVMSYQIRGSYVQPLKSGKFIEVLYRRQNFDNELLKEVYDEDMGGETFNELLSNHYDRNFVYDRGGLALHFNNELSSLTLEAQVQHSSLTGDIISENVVIKNSSTYFLPRISWRKELGSSHNINLRYSTSVREPSLQQLQPIVDNSDPLNIYQGNPDLVNEYRHNMRLHYINFDQFSFSSLFGFISASYTKNNITNETIIDENFVRVTKPVNVDYNFNINGNISYSTPIRSMGMKVRFNTRVGYQNSFVFINSTENKANRYNTRFGITFDNRSKKKIDVSVGGNWSYNVTKYSESENSNQSFFNHFYDADVIYKPTDNWILKTDFRLNVYANQNFSEGETIPLLHGSLSRFITASKKIELKVSVFDLLDQNKGINRSSNLNYIENEEIVSLGRYFLFGITYNIRGTSPQGQGGGRGGRMHVR